MFDAPYIYTGGDLVVEVIHRGFSGTSRSVEAVLAMNGPAGVYGVQTTALWTATLTNATGTQGNAAVFSLSSAPAGANLTGTVDLSGSDADWSNEKVTIQIVDPANNTLQGTVVSRLGASGAYSTILPVGPGTYDLYFKGDTFLKKRIANVVLTSGSNSESVSLTNGDIDGDNEVGGGDFAVLSAAWDTVAGGAGFDPAADLDDDGEVGGGDFAILSGSWDQVGDDF